MSWLAQIDWNSLLHKPDVLPLLVVIGGATLVGLAGIIAHQWRKARQASDEVRLKERMIERGFGAEEIQTVIKATADPKEVREGVQITSCESR